MAQERPEFAGRGQVVVLPWPRWLLGGGVDQCDNTMNRNLSGVGGVVAVEHHQ